MPEKDKIIELEKTLPQENDPVKKIDLLNQISYGLRHNDVKKSSARAQEARQLSEKINYSKGLADSLSILGFHEIQLSNNEQAFEYLFKALHIYKETGCQKELSLPLYLLGLVNKRLSNYKKALDFFLQSKEISARSGDKLQEAQALINIALIYSNFNDLDSAIPYALQSLSYARELGNSDHEGYTLMAIGEIYLTADDFENSIKYLNESIKLRSATGELTSNITYSRIGKWHEKQHQYEEALVYYNKLLESGIRFNHTFVQVMAMLGISTCYDKINRKEDAKTMLKKALVVAESIHSKGSLVDIQRQLAEIYKSEKNYSQALFHYEKFHELKEEVHDTESAARLKNITVLNKLESAEKDAEIERLRNVELKNANDELDSTNKELQETIDELTKTRISKLATTFTLVVAVILFILSEGFLDPLVDAYSQNSWMNMAAKFTIALLLKPIESFIEKMMLANAVRKKRLSKATAITPLQ